MKKTELIPYIIILSWVGILVNATYPVFKIISQILFGFYVYMLFWSILYDGS